MSVPSANDMRRLAIEGKRAVHNPAFDYALKKVSNHVIEASKQRYMSVMCELPEFVFGCPAFKVQACAKYASKCSWLAKKSSWCRGPPRRGSLSQRLRR